MTQAKHKERRHHRYINASIVGFSPQEEMLSKALGTFPHSANRMTTFNYGQDKYNLYFTCKDVHLSSIGGYPLSGRIRKRGEIHLVFVLYDASDPDSYAQACASIEEEPKIPPYKVLVRYKSSTPAAEGLGSSTETEDEEACVKRDREFVAKFNGNVQYHSINENEFTEQLFGLELERAYNKLYADTSPVPPPPLTCRQRFFRRTDNNRILSTALWTISGAAIPVLIYAGFLALKALNAISPGTSQRVIFHSINVPTSVGIGGGFGFAFGLLMVALAYGATRKPSPSTAPGAMPIQASD